MQLNKDDQMCVCEGGLVKGKAWNEEQVGEMAACLQMGVGVKQKGKDKDYYVF